MSGHNNNYNNNLKRRFNSINDNKESKEDNSNSNTNTNTNTNNNNKGDNDTDNNNNEIFYLTPSSNNKYISKYNQSELNELIGNTCRFILLQQSKNKIIKLSMLSKYLLKHQETNNENIYSIILASDLLKAVKTYFYNVFGLNLTVKLNKEIEKQKNSQLNIKKQKKKIQNNNIVNTNNSLENNDNNNNNNNIVSSTGFYLLINPHVMKSNIDNNNDNNILYEGVSIVNHSPLYENLIDFHSLIVILGIIIHINDNNINEKILYKQLEQLTGLTEKTTHHPYFGNIAELIQRFIKENYFQRIKGNEAMAIEYNNNNNMNMNNNISINAEDYYYSLGVRFKCEIGEENLYKFLCNSILHIQPDPSKLASINKQAQKLNPVFIINHDMN